MNNKNDFISTVKRYRGSVTQGVAQIYKFVIRRYSNGNIQ